MQDPDLCLFLPAVYHLMKSSGDLKAFSGMGKGDIKI